MRTGPLLRLPSPFAAIALAIIAQQILQDERNVALAIGLYIAAVALILWRLPRDAPENFPLPTPRANPRRHFGVRVAFALASIVCAVLSFWLNASISYEAGGAQYHWTPEGVLAWFASVAFFFAAFWQRESSAAEWRGALAARFEKWRSHITLHLTWTNAALVAVILLGAFFYFCRLDALPAEMTSDHAEKLLDVNDVREGYAPIFFIRNTGREPLQFYLTAALMRVFDLSLGYLVLKAGTALVGFLVVPATFFLAREMFDAETGILAAFFVAVMHWAVTIARIGLRYPFTPFFAALSLCFLWRALKHQNRNDYLIAGLALGIGLYGYIPSRSVPLVALGLCALWLVLRGWTRVNLRQFAFNIGLMLALALVVFAPLLRYSLDYPGEFWYRALTRVSNAERAVEGNALVILGKNLANLALAFNWRGDEIWVTNIATQPTLDAVSGALFILGIALAIYKLVRDRAPAYLFLLAAFAALLAPSALALAFPRENPSHVRMGGAIPFTAILLALPAREVWRAARQGLAAFRGAGLIGITLVGVILAPTALLNVQWYFADYDQSARQSSQNSSEVAAVLRDFSASVGDLRHTYYVGYPYWIDWRAIAIQIGDLKWRNFSMDASQLFTDDNANLLFIVHPDDKENLEKLRERYPQGQTRTHRSRTPGKDFLSFFVPAFPP